MKKLSIYLYLIIFLLIASIKSSFAIDSDIKDMLDNLDGVQKSIKDLDESKLQEAVKIDAAVEELNTTIQPVAQKMYEAAAAEEQQQPEAQPASNQEDDVIDADFEVKE